MSWIKIPGTDWEYSFDPETTDPENDYNYKDNHSGGIRKDLNDVEVYVYCRKTTKPYGYGEISKTSLNVEYPPENDIFGYYDGITYLNDDQQLIISSLPYGTHTGQVKGTSVAGDGTGYGTLSETVTAVGDFVISFEVDTTAGDRFIFISTDEASFLRYNSTYWKVRIGGIDVAFYNVTNLAGSVTVVRSGTSLALTVGDQTETKTCLTSDFIIDTVGRSEYIFPGNLYDLKITDSTGLILDLAMTCLGSSTEYSSTPGLPDCVWSDFVSDPIVEHTDGTGSNRANEDGYSERENRLPAKVVVAEITVTDIDTDLDIYSAIINDTSSPARSISYTYPTTDSIWSGIFKLKAIPTTEVVGFGLYEGGWTGNTAEILSGDGTIVAVGGYFKITGLSEDEFTYIKVTKSDVIAAARLMIYPDYTGTPTVGNGCIVGEVSLQKGDSSDTDYVAPVVIGRQPAGFQNRTTQYPGPIRPDLTPVKMPCLKGDGSGYVTLDPNPQAISGLKAVAEVQLPALSTPGVKEVYAIYSSWNSFAPGSQSGWRFGVASDTDATCFFIFSVCDGTDYLELKSTRIAVATFNSTYCNRLLNVRVEYTGGTSLTIFVDDTQVATVTASVPSQIDESFTTPWLLRAGVSVAISTMGINSLKLYDDLNTLVHHYPCESGHPTHNPDIVMLEDIVGGNHGTATSFTGSCWGERDDGDFALLEGMSVDRDDAVELWADPTTEVVDSNNYTEWDSETGIGHIVSDGTFSELRVFGATTIGEQYRITLTEVGTGFGGLKVTIPLTSITLGESLIYTASSTSGSCILSRDVGACDRYFTVTLKRVIKGYNAVNSDGTHQDGTLPKYKKNTWDLVRYLPANMQGALGPKTQALPQFTGVDNIRLCDEAEVGASNQVFIGTKGMATYDADQSANVDQIDSVLDVLGDELVTNGDFSNGTTGWTAYNDASLSIVDDRLRVTQGTVDWGYARQNVPVVSGSSYIISVMGHYGTSDTRISAGGVDTVASQYPEDGVEYKYIVTATSSELLLNLAGRVNIVGYYTEYSRVSIKKVNSGCTIETGSIIA